MLRRLLAEMTAGVEDVFLRSYEGSGSESNRDMLLLVSVFRGFTSSVIVFIINYNSKTIILCCIKFTFIINYLFCDEFC